MDQIPLALEHWFFWATGLGKGFTPSIGKHDKHALYHIEGIPNNNTLPKGDAMRIFEDPKSTLLGSAWLPEADGGLELEQMVWASLLRSKKLQNI